MELIPIIVALLFILLLTILLRKLNRNGLKKSFDASKDCSLRNLPKQFETCLAGHKLLVKSWNRDSKLHQQGRKDCEKELKNNLLNLLGMHKYVSEHPEIRTIQIKRPIFIVAWLRTGSTLLHNLLALDPNNCTPYVWETLYPLSPPDSSDIHSDIVRRKALASQEIDKFYADGFEDFRCIFNLSVEDPAQCVDMFKRCFIDRRCLIDFQTMEEYTEWFTSLEQNQIDAIYQLYKSELQYHTYCKRERDISCERVSEKQWCLKDVIHLYFIESLLRTFPDAIILNLHRDPIQVLGSLVSGSHFYMKKFYLHEDIQSEKLAQRCLQQMKVCKNRLLGARSGVMEWTGRAESDVFLDVKFRDLCSDPINTINSIYSRIGKASSEEHFSEMRQYLLKDSQTKYGKHMYDITEYGITKEEIQNIFQDYIENFLT